MSNSSLEAVAQAIAHFYARLDGLDAGSVGACFAPDGVWHRQGAVLKGPAAVDATLGQRPAGRSSVHLVSNLQCESQGDGHFSARYLLQVFRHDAAPGAAPGVTRPAPIEGSLLGITHTVDTWVRSSAGQWLLREKDSRVLFLKG